jgi:hypothetical protein
MKIGRTALGPFAIGAVLLVGFLLFSRKALTSDDALALVQELVKSPDWVEQGLFSRPFEEYYAWEVEEMEQGDFVVTARHRIVGPTEFTVTSSGAVIPIPKVATLGESLKILLEK